MRRRSSKLILATSLTVAVAAIVGGVASAQVATSTQTEPPAPSDSAAFPGGGTVSVLGVDYPRGTAVPAVGSPESGPTGRRAVSTSVPTTAQTSSSDGGTVSSPDGKQPTASPSDSAAFPGGGTVSVLGVNYPKGTSVPTVGTSESGPTLLPTEGYYAAPSSSGGGFDWPDAGIGLAIGLGAVGVIALVVIGIRKHTATPITV